LEGLMIEDKFLRSDKTSIISKNEKAVLYLQYDGIYFVWKTEDGWWDWFEDDDHKGFASLKEAKAEFLLRSI
jgi:hypothetical protein